MDALSAIFSRRSIRLYTDKQVAQETVEDILRAGMSAPSAGNERPWHFVVLTDRDILGRIPTFHPYSAMLKHASAAILVCGDPSLSAIRATGCWTARLLPRTCCWQHMQKGWVRSGAEYTRRRTG